MKPVLLFPLILFYSFTPVSVLGRGETARVLKAGAATSDIAPPLGMEIVGNFAPRPIDGNVHDELHVRCLALDDATTRLVFVVADAISLGRKVWDEARQKMETLTGIPAANLMFSTTHTHSSVAPVASLFLAIVITIR